jgi:disulfide bond formation protein DsbB
MSRRDIEAPVLVFLAGLATILAAWGFELIGGYVPCKLCLEQRIPYYVGLPFALVAVVAAFAKAPPRIPRTFLILAGLTFLVGAGLAVYHAGAEWTWWAGPADCGGGTATTGSAGDLLDQIGKIKVVSCTEASWRFLGLSFAGWNALISVFLVVVAFFGAFRRTEA